MQPGFISTSQAHSQPVLPSQRSRYFYYGIEESRASQSRSRLSPLQVPPGMSRSSTAAVTSRGRMAPLRAGPPPHPFFSQGPAARGYIPQQALRYPRHPGLEEPIVPLRTQFSNASNVCVSDRSMASRELQQPRPYSVPALPLQTYRAPIDHSARAITRPTSVVHTTSAPVLFDLDHPEVEPFSEDEKLGASPDPPHDLMPPKRTLPFPTGKQTTQYTSGKATSSRKAPELQSVNKPANSKGKNLNKRSTSANHKTSEPPTKIRLVGRRTDYPSGSSQRGQNTPTYISTSTFEHVDKKTPEESHLSQLASEALKSISISRTPDAVVPHANPPRAKEPRLIGVNHNTEAGITCTTSASNPGHPPPIPTGPPPFTDQDRSSASEILQELLTQASTTPAKPLCMASDIPTRPTLQRSASQATTVSSASTELPCEAKNDDAMKKTIPSNTMSMIDETMIVERDISSIVTMRIQQGKPDLLDALYGEILIKMAVRDEALFESVSRMLES